jgi:predicted ArsR family transcriptional regulator
MTRDEYLAALRPRTLNNVQRDEVSTHARILAALRRRGGIVSRYVLTRSLGLNSATLTNAVAVLSEAGLIRIEYVQTAGRPATVYHLVEQ